MMSKYRHYSAEEISRQKARHLAKQRKNQIQVKDKEKTQMSMFKDLKTNLVLSGNFDAVFKGCVHITRKNFDNPDIDEPAFRFSFFVPGKKGTVEVTTSCSTGKKSNFRKVMGWLLGENFKVSILTDSDYLEKTLNEDLMNKPYQITCQPSESGERTVIVACFPGGSAQPEGKPVNYVEDDIKW